MPVQDDPASSAEAVDSCPICQEPYEDGQLLRILPCSHSFHAGCFDPWIKARLEIDNQCLCPTCLCNVLGNLSQAYLARYLASSSSTRAP
eukprot:scaffold466546_cov43-Prasinocladus_malaysianus.AAC.1